MRKLVLIELMAEADWPEVRRIYAEGIATTYATLDNEAPDWSHFDHSHRHDCRLVARDRAGGPVLGWTALTAYSSRRVYAGVAWESVYVGAAMRGRGVGRALLEALVPASEGVGLWTLLAAVLADNTSSLALHEAVGFRHVVLLERRSTVVGIE
jgi:L-amino acid N-acyltransferase YncA